MTLELRARMTRILLVAAAVAAATAGCNRSSASPAKPAPAATAPAAAVQLGKGDLEVVVNGKPSGAWTMAQIEKAASVATMHNQNGEERQVWPLKTLARSLVGDKARVVAVASAGERVAIDEKQWNAEELVLRMNHHGEYKAMWVDGNGNADEAFLKGVRRVELAQ